MDESSSDDSEDDGLSRLWHVCKDPMDQDLTDFNELSTTKQSSSFELRFKYDYDYNGNDYFDSNLSTIDSKNDLFSKYKQFNLLDMCLKELSSSHINQLTLFNTKQFINGMGIAQLLNRDNKHKINLKLIPRCIVLLKSDKFGNIAYQILLLIIHTSKTYYDSLFNNIHLLINLINNNGPNYVGINQYIFQILGNLAKSKILYRNELLMNNILGVIFNKIRQISWVTVQNSDLLIILHFLKQICTKPFINTLYIPILLKISHYIIKNSFNTLSNHHIHDILFIYEYIFKLNTKHHLFNGDIIFCANLFVSDFMKQKYTLLLNGIIRKINWNTCSIPNDVKILLIEFIEPFTIDIDLCNGYKKVVFNDFNQSSRYYDIIMIFLSNGLDDNNNQTMQLKTAQRIRELVSTERNPPIKSVINAGIVPKLINILNNCSDSGLLCESAWALTNIASGTHDDIQFVIGKNGIPAFIRLLSLSSSKVSNQAIWGLGNIVGDCAEARDIVLNHNFLYRVSIISRDYNNYHNKNSLDILKNISWALSNCCRHDPPPKWKYIQDIMKCFMYLLNTENIQVYSDFCWGISFLSKDVATHNKLIPNIKKNGLMRRLVDLLEHNSSVVQTPAVRAIGNIAGGSDINVDSLIDCGLLYELYQIFNLNNFQCPKREICWLLSQITAGTTQQIELIKEENIFPFIINMLQNVDNEKFENIKEALWTIRNAVCSGNDKQIKYLIDINGLDAVCKFIINYKHTYTILPVACECLDNMLNVSHQIIGDNKYAVFVKECGCLDTLQSILSGNISDVLHDQLHTLLNKYW